MFFVNFFRVDDKLKKRKKLNLVYKMTSGFYIIIYKFKESNFNILL